MQNACIAIGAICQRALRPLFTALCPVPASEMVGDSEEHALSGCISDLYYYFLREQEKRCGRKAPIESLPQAIKRSYGMNTTLIQSFGRVYFIDGPGGDGEVMAVMDKSSRTRQEEQS